MVLKYYQSEAIEYTFIPTILIIHVIFHNIIKIIH